MKFDPRRIDNFIRRAVEALESIAGSLKKDEPAPAQLTTNVYNSSPELDAVETYRRTKQALSNIKGETLPTFFMNSRDGDETIDLDNEAAQGFARIEPDGIFIKLAPEYYPRLVRQILAEGEPAGFSVRVHHRKPLT